MAAESTEYLHVKAQDKLHQSVQQRKVNGSVQYRSHSRQHTTRNERKRQKKNVDCSSQVTEQRPAARTAEGSHCSEKPSGFAGARIRPGTTSLNGRVVKVMTPGYKWLTSRSSRASTATPNTADGRVRNVAIRGRTVARGIIVTLERSRGLILPLATCTVDVPLGAPHTLGLACHGYRIAPVGHPPHAAMLEVLGQVLAPSRIVVETAVLLAPLGDVAVRPLLAAALSHSSHTHAGHEDIEPVARDIATVVDDLVEERADLARLGADEIGNVAGTLVLPLGGAGHGCKRVAHSRVDIVRPGLLATALELPAATASGRVGIVALGAGDNRLAVGETGHHGVVYRCLAVKRQDTREKKGQ